MSASKVTYQETTAALVMFRETERLTSDLDGMWAVLTADREAQAAPTTAPSLAEEAIIERFTSLSSTAIRRILDAGATTIEQRAEDGVTE